MIIPSAKYPSQTAVDLTNYPQGKARNVTASGDGTGTPFEKDWVNDWFGFQQAAALAAGITPSGVPDTAVSSQLLDAIRSVVQLPCALYQITGTKNTGQNFVLTDGGLAVGTGWSLASNVVTVPAAGKYRIAFMGAVDCFTSSNPQTISVSVLAGGSGIRCTAQPLRFSGTATDVIAISAETIANIVTPGTQGITIVPGQNSTTFGFGNLIIERVG